MGIYNTKDQLIIEGSYTTMGPNGLRADIFLCSFCLKRFNEDKINLKDQAKLHETESKLRLSELEEGVVSFKTAEVKSLPIEQKEIINKLGYLSKAEQHTDGQMTHISSIINQNQTIYV